MGSMGHQLTGKIEYKDEANGLVGYYEPGKYRMKTQDYICGDIKSNGSKVCDITGNYMGFCDFDKKRYWDIRDCEKIWFPILQLDESKCLASDSKFRKDSLTLKSGDVVLAQTVKEELEELQRHDRSLRESVAKRREQGGAKIVYPPGVIAQ